MSNYSVEETATMALMAIGFLESIVKEMGVDLAGATVTVTKNDLAVSEDYQVLSFLQKTKIELATLKDSVKKAVNHD